MKHFGLIGKVLVHSFSKKFFTEKFAKEGIDAQYDLYELPVIDDFKHLITTKEFCGFNVTIPYKEQIIPFLDSLDPIAEGIGAVNTVKFIRENGKTELRGYNTDIIGFTDSIKPLLRENHNKALVLGTGGASKAVQYVLNKYNLAYSIVSRDKERGDYTYDTLTADVIAHHKLIINATPVGMSPNKEQAPMLPYEAFGAEHKVFDLIYNPATTQLLSRAKEQGSATMNGILMLQTQAIASWHIWQRAYEEFKEEAIC